MTIAKKMKSTATKTKKTTTKTKRSPRAVASTKRASLSGNQNVEPLIQSQEDDALEGDNQPFEVAAPSTPIHDAPVPLTDEHEGNALLARIMKRVSGTAALKTPVVLPDAKQQEKRGRGRPRKTAVTAQESVINDTPYPMSQAISLVIKVLCSLVTSFTVPQQYTYMLPSSDEYDVLLAPIGRIIDRHKPEGITDTVSPDAIDAMMFAQAIQLYIGRVSHEMARRTTNDEYINFDPRAFTSTTSSNGGAGVNSARNAGLERDHSGHLRATNGSQPSIDTLTQGDSGQPHPDVLTKIDSLLARDHAGRRRLGLAP